MSRAIILLQFQFCTYLISVVIYVLLLSYDYFDETLRRNVPKYHCGKKIYVVLIHEGYTRAWWPQKLGSSFGVGLGLLHFAEAIATLTWSAKGSSEVKEKKKKRKEQRKRKGSGGCRATPPVPLGSLIQHPGLCLGVCS